jgi:hypothetical protein
MTDNRIALTLFFVGVELAYTMKSFHAVFPWVVILTGLFTVGYGPELETVSGPFDVRGVYTLKFTIAINNEPISAFFDAGWRLVTPTLEWATLHDVCVTFGVALGLDLTRRSGRAARAAGTIITASCVLFGIALQTCHAAIDASSRICLFDHILFGLFSGQNTHFIAGSRARNSPRQRFLGRIRARRNDPGSR